MNRGLELRTIEELWQFANYVLKAGIRRGSVKSAEQAVCIIQHGAEVGMPPMTAIKCITIKGDVPTIDGEGALALVRASDLEEWTKVGCDGEGQNIVGWCETKRVNLEPVKRTFSFADAKAAGLLNRGLKMYEKYPQRMFTYRAVGFCLRDVFPDVLGGLHLTEEIEEEPLHEAPECKTPPRAERRKPADTDVVPETPTETPPADTDGSKDADAGGDFVEDDDTLGSTMAVAMVKAVRTSMIVDLLGKTEADCEKPNAMFVAMAAMVLACPEEDCNSPKKFSVNMLKKVQAYIDEQREDGSE